MNEEEKKLELYKIRHSAEHILAHAITQLFPGKIKLAVAHISDDGFSNDARWEVEIAEKDLPKIEQKMREIINKKLPIVKKEISIGEAKELFKDNPFKLEWIEEASKESATLSVYWLGDEYVDFCKGPHVENTSEVKAIKLLSIAGSYWRGDEKNEMLTRIYGTAFSSKEELDEHLKRLEEAKLRDHRKIGKDLDLFVFSEVVGKGLPMWTARGATIRRELENFIVDEEIKRGYQHVYTPELANIALYKKSGHYPYYKDSMYPPIKIEEDEFMLRPMTCPHHYELYLSQQRSYKDLPMRIAELAKLFRYEKSGELSGLMRVRSFCLADAHIIATPEQAEQEIHGAMDLIEFVSNTFGLKIGEDYRYRLSLGDRSDDKKYYKDDASWNFAENVLRKVLNDRQAPFYEAEHEAAFYGPKIDVQMKNVLGKEDTAFTVQYDFVMPERFKLNYIAEDGSEKQGIVIHRSSIGAIERMMAFLIEHFYGNFPVWLHPDQIVIIPIGLEQHDYALDIEKSIREELPKIRMYVDKSNNTLNKRILAAQNKKVPYMIILGKKEVENKTINVRLRTGESLGEINLNEFITRVNKKITDRALDL